MINPEQKTYLDSEEFIEGLKCLDLELPWIVSESVLKLDELLKEDDTVIEFGVGGSTLFFARRCKRVIGIETQSIYEKKYAEDKTWPERVNDTILKRGILNTAIFVIPEEEKILSFIQGYDTEKISVLSVDTQGGYNRSAILNAFLNKGISPNLRLIILDNYNHHELFPDYDSYIPELPGWVIMDFKHPRWAGDGTRLIINT